MGILQKLSSIKSSKEAISGAIEGKGITVGSTPLSGYATLISQISGEGGGSSDFDFSAATVTITDLLEGSKAYDSNGYLIDGAIPTVVATKSGNTVTVPNGYIASQQIIAVGTSKAAQTYTPTTTDQTISADTYIAGTQTIKGDSNLIAGNIKSGTTIFGVTGSYQGDSGSSNLSFDIVKITNFVKGHDAYSVISSIVLSDFPGYDENTGMDFSQYNKTYVVTRDTRDEINWKNRIYQSTEPQYGSTYLFLKYFQRSASEYEDAYMDYLYGGYDGRWGFTTNPSYNSSSDLGFGSNSDFPSGQISWESEMGYQVQSTSIKSIISEGVLPSSLIGIKATDYSSESGLFTYNNNNINFTEYDEDPIPHQIYISNGSKIIGKRVCSGVSEKDVVFQLNPALYGFLDVAGGLKGKPNKDNLILNNKFVFDGSSYIEFDTSYADYLNFGTSDCTIEFFSKTTAGTVTYPCEITNAKAWSDGHIAIRYGNDVGNKHYQCWIYPNSEPFFNTNNEYEYNTWKHVAFVREGNFARLYINGQLDVENYDSSVENFKGRTINFKKWNILRLGWGECDGDNGYFTGEIGEVRITRRALYSGTSFIAPTTFNRSN